MLRVIYVVSHLPLVNRDGSVWNHTSFYYVFYYDDIVMYKFNYGFDSTVNGKRLVQEVRNKFFVFQKDSLFGYTYYPAPNHPLGTDRLLVEPALQTNSFRDNKLDSLLNFKVDSSYFDTQNNLVKIYNLPASKDYGEKFTVYLYYTKELKDIPETFSEKMDNVKDMKLFKARIVGHGMYYDPDKVYFPERESSNEIKEVPIENREEIIGYFNRYKKEHLKN